MAVKVTIPVALEKKIREAALSGPVMEHAAAMVRQLISLLDDAHDKRTKKAENGLNPNDVIRAVKNILGGKVSVPPNPGHAFYGYLAKRCQFLNVSIEDIEKAAVFVRTGNSTHCRLPNSLDWFMRKLDLIMLEAEQYEAPEEAADEWVLNLGR